MSDQSVKFLDRNPPTFSEATAKEIAHDLYGLTGDFTPLMSERDQNFRVKMENGEAVTLKISNVAEDAGTVDMQIQLLNYLEKHAPDLPLPRMAPSKNNALSELFVAENGDKHIIRVVSYLPGMVMEEAENTTAMRRNLGAMLAQLDIALRGFFHPNARQAHPWDLTRSPELLPFVHYIQDAEIRSLTKAHLRHMSERVLPALKGMRHQIIHQDAHRGNVLLNPENPDEIAGIIDFGDMLFAPLISEIAVAASSAAVSDPVAAIADIVIGYDRISPLESDEIDILFDLVMARHAITIILIEQRNAETPNQPAHNADEAAYLEQLQRNVRFFTQLGRKKATDQIRAACRFPPSIPNRVIAPSEEEAEATLPALRAKLLGKHAHHFYQQPLHVERGRDVWLFGANGAKYLDCYNNVPQVGHCHPHVVRAISRQAAALNTHTRYLYRAVLEYAERLTATLPHHLSACVFVNSGSEANDIAWQIAKMVSGAQGAVVMEDAYHGITDAITPLSPDRPGVDFEPHVAGLLTPDPYRGKYRAGEPDLAAKYAADADRAIVELEERGVDVAALMVDSALCSSGIPEEIKGYLPAVADKVRAAGGLIICDEVQSGFGRLGVMWGHQLRGVRADIVTMGKPVGNGFPLGVVVTSPEILNAFVKETGLFSTFGGNPVACAAGSAVLDVIESEKLIDNAKTTGDYWRECLREMMESQPLIGDVRGDGLLAAVELVKDRKTKMPATSETKQLLELMRENGVLVGGAGRASNILKLRPPISFQPRHVDIFCAALERSLSERNRASQ